MTTEIPSSVKTSLEIVLVPGSNATPIIFDGISRSLTTKGYTRLVPVPLPSACPADNQRQPPAKLADDALYIREVLQALLEKGKDILVVLCSYGGFPGTEALVGLPSRSKISTRTQEGEQAGAIVGVVYLSSFMPFPGDSLISMKKQPSLELGTYVALPPELKGTDLFTEWAKEGDKRAKDIEYYFSGIITHSADSLENPVTLNLWAEGTFHGKIAFVIGEEDGTVPPALREEMLTKVNEARAEKVNVTELAGAGHLMVLERPDEIVEATEKLIASLIK